MWDRSPAWFDLAVILGVFALGSILFGRFEQHKPRARPSTRVGRRSSGCRGRQWDRLTKRWCQRAGPRSPESSRCGCSPFSCSRSRSRGPYGLRHRASRRPATRALWRPRSGVLSWGVRAGARRAHAHGASGGPRCVTRLLSRHRALAGGRPLVRTGPRLLRRTKASCSCRPSSRDRCVAAVRPHTRGDDNPRRRHLDVGARRARKSGGAATRSRDSHNTSASRRESRAGLRMGRVAPSAVRAPRQREYRAVLPSVPAPIMAMSVVLHTSIGRRTAASSS